MSDTDGIRDSARDLDTDADLDPLLAAARTARFVLIGEASHGGHEYYAWRAAITRRLIAEHGFGFVAVEGDGPDQRLVDAAVRGDTDSGPGTVLAGLTGWPSWLWSNTETAGFGDWLREHNAPLPHRHRVGWYGLDAHPLHASMRTVAEHLRRHAPDHLATAFARPDTPLVPAEHVDTVTALLARVHEPESDDREHQAQDAKLRAGAEGYYHAMLTGGTFARNTRAGHMLAVLEDLADHHGPGSRAVVWAHNTHVGDARATGLRDTGEHNLGQYLKERHGDTDVFTIGFAGGTGRVIAAPGYGEPMRAMDIRPPKPGSLEAELTAAGLERAWFRLDARAPGWSREWRDQRAIGVVYDPDNEYWTPTLPAERYDALAWFATTTPLDAIHLAEPG